LATALQTGALLGAPVRAVHVQVAGVGVPEYLADTGVPLRVVQGDVVPRLVEEGEAGDVAALVIGSRARADPGRPLGTTASGVATAVRKPVVVVPPDAGPSADLRSILVPLEGTPEDSLATRFWVERAVDLGLDVLALHVLTPQTVPDPTDRRHPEQSGWEQEFLRRYCPWGRGAVELLTRVG